LKRFKFETSDKYRSFLQKLQLQIRVLSERFERHTQCLKELIEQLINDINNRLREIGRLLEIAKKLQGDENLKVIEETYRDLVSKLLKLRQDFVRHASIMKYREIQAKINSLRIELMSICRKFLTNEEIKLYEEIYDLVKKDVKDLSLVINEISKKHDMEYKDVLNNIIKLYDRGVIKLEVIL